MNAEQCHTGGEFEKIFKLRMVVGELQHNFVIIIIITESFIEP